MNRLNKCVVACSCAEKWGWDQFGRKGNKDFWRAMLTLHRCPTCTRWLQSRAAGGGKGLMIACLPQSQVHLDFPTSSCKLALARLPMHEKTTGSDVLAHTEHFLFGHAVYCKWGAKRKRGGLYEKYANLTEFACTRIHFSLFNQPSRHESSWGKTEERWISSLRAVEKIRETYWNQDHTEEERGK